jgi:hypothetical protein
MATDIERHLERMADWARMIAATLRAAQPPVQRQLQREHIHGTRGAEPFLAGWLGR